MQHFWSLEEVTVEGAWLTIGSFDGVHRGHQEIIRRLATGAHSENALAVVVTFYPHPGIVLRGLSGPFYLTSPEERAKLLGDLGVDIVVTHPFNREVASTSALDFLIHLKQHLDFRKLWVGYNFALGRGREGDVPTLYRLGNELGFDLEVLPPVEIDGQVISSSQARTFLQNGDMEKTARLLGRFYRINGKVVHGDGRGQTIGIPTANLTLWSEQILPTNGVYACRAQVDDQQYEAAVNIGIRPTFDGRSPLLQVEAHLLDFEGDLYGKNINLDFVTRLRGEKRFPSVEALVDQIQEDINQTRKVLFLTKENDRQLYH